MSPTLGPTIDSSILQSDHSDESGSESEFEADPEELAVSASSDEESDYGDSDAGGSDESGSDFGGGDDDSDEGSYKKFIHLIRFAHYIVGDDWDELERKAAKCMFQCRTYKLTVLTFKTADQKRAEGKKTGGSDDSEDERPKKNGAKKANGKAKAKR